MKKAANLIKKLDANPSGKEEVVSFLAGFLPGGKQLAASWIDEILANPFDIESTLAERYAAHITQVRHKWESVYAYYYEQLVNNLMLEGKPLKMFYFNTDFGVVQLGPALADNSEVESTGLVLSLMRMRLVSDFFDNYISYHIYSYVGEGGDWGENIDAKIEIRANIGSTAHVIPCILATCDGLFKEFLAEQEHEAILRTYLETITSPAFVLLQGQHPYAAIFARLVASARPYMKKQVEIQQESEPPQRANQPQPWIPQCPICASALKFKPEHGVWHCAKCDEYYKV
nr:hypothetical protein [Candidatus Sigynarchaeum springense]